MGETLLLYTTTTPHTISIALVVEHEKEGHVLKVQRPVYFVSEVLSDLKAWYLRIQKILYAMLIAKRKLWYYFDANPIVVVSSSGLWDIINNQESTGRITKWGHELMGLDITYAPRTTIRSQALIDFILEWTKEQAMTAPVKVEYWIMYFDGSLTLEGAGVGVLLISPNSDKLRYALQLHFQANNNVAEYEELLHGIQAAIKLGARRLFV